MKEEENIYTTNTTNRISNLNRVYMESFFIPKDKGLKRVHLLLIEKDGKKIIAGGEYHKGLRACETIASLRIDLEKETIEIFNHSEIELTFTNFDNMFWRLDDIDVSSQDNGIYTRILLDDSSIEEQNNQNKKSDSIDIKERIEPDKSFEFRTKEMEFNDTNVSFNEDGVLIRYSKFR